MSRRRRKLTILVMASVALYLAILVAPGLMGGVVDEAQGSFAGGVTRVGGLALQSRARQTMGWVREECGRGHFSLCEIGPGRGVLARAACNDPECLYFAIDMEQRSLDAICGAMGRYCCRVPPMPAEMPAVDAIVAENVLEHSTGYQEAKAMLLAFRGKLNPGGCVVLRCPSVLHLVFGFWDGAQDHQYVTSLRRLTMLCRECGFRIDRCGLAFDHWTGKTGWLVYQVKRCWPWRIMHNMFYQPWQTSPWSKLGEKVPHCYVVAVHE